MVTNRFYIRKQFIFMALALALAGLLGLRQLGLAAPPPAAVALIVPLAPAAASSAAEDINNQGQVVGTLTETDGDWIQAFLWQQDGLALLDAPGGSGAVANAINDAGQVAGSIIVDAPAGPGRGVHQPALWQAGDLAPAALASPTLLLAPVSALAGSHASATAVNEAGAAAGIASPLEADGLAAALFWPEVGQAPVAAEATGAAYALALNNQGQAAGRVEVEPGVDHAALWQGGEMVDLGTLGGRHCTALDLNDGGAVVGSSQVAGDASRHAFLWQEGMMVDLGTLGDPATAASEALAINNHGDIVGQATDGDGARAVLWRQGVLVDLNEWLPVGAGWERLLSARGINDQGWIVGVGLREGRRQAFLLVPAAAEGTPAWLLAAASAASTAEGAASSAPTTWLRNTGYAFPAGATMTPTVQLYLPFVPRQTDLTNEPFYDMTQFMVGDGRLYEVQHSNGSQARHQTQVEGTTFYHTKGNEIKAEWEELWHTPAFISRGADTSPGNGQYYILRDHEDKYGSAWSPRSWSVGDLFERNPLVTFYHKQDCSVVFAGFQKSYLLFEAYHASFTFASGITLNNVVQLAWLPAPGAEPIERYFYAENYGLVGWQSNDRGLSGISEIHPPGARPDNKREVIGCLSSSLAMLPRPQLYQQLPSDLTPSVLSEAGS